MVGLRGGRGGCRSRCPSCFGQRLAEDGSFLRAERRPVRAPRGWLPSWPGAGQARRPLIGMLVALFACRRRGGQRLPAGRDVAVGGPSSSIHLPIAFVAGGGAGLRGRRLALVAPADGLHPLHRRVLRLLRTPRPRRRCAHRVHVRHLQGHRDRPAGVHRAVAAFRAAPWPRSSWPGGSSRPSRG